MKRVLYLSPQSVIPPVDGGKIGIYFPLKYLARVYKIFFAYIRNSNESDDVKDQYRRIEVEPIGFDLDTNDNVSLIIRNVFKKCPFKMEKYYNSKFYSLLKELVLKEDIRVVLVSHPHMAEYALKLKIDVGVKIILREHNVEYDLVEQFYKTQFNVMKKFVGFWQAIKTRKYEVGLWEKFDKVVFISDSDYAMAVKILRISKKDSFCKICRVYDGFEPEDFNEIVNRKYINDSFVFSGNVKTVQNRTNLKAFISEIWLKYIIVNRRAALYLTGSSDKDIERFLGFSVDDLEKMRIINLGFVGSLNEALLDKQFFLSPTVIGSGIRIKILHAMSLGIPVIASDIDFSMVDAFEDMVNIVHYRNYDEFCNKVKLLALDKEIFTKIQKNSKSLVEKKLNWNSYLSQMIDVIERL